MAAITWDELQTACLVMLAQAPSPYDEIPPDFTVLFPQATSYAEGRIYKDLVLLATRDTNSSLVTVNGSREIDLSAITPNPIIVPEGLALIVPAGQTNPALGTQVHFDETSLDVIDIFWPQASITLSPSAADNIGRFWAMKDDHTLVMSPTPNGAYTALVTGLFQPTPISDSNQTTYVSAIYPELLTAACMIFLSGALQRNFGAQSDDPQQAQSWEMQYGKLRDLALMEEQRRRGQGAGWSANAPSPIAQPPRS